VLAGADIAAITDLRNLRNLPLIHRYLTDGPFSVAVAGEAACPCPKGRNHDRVQGLVVAPAGQLADGA
jgi:hypothetical protein